MLPPSYGGNRTRGGQLEQEPGPPQIPDPRSNLWKFPDTSNDWWPTDRNPKPFSREDGPGGWGVHWYEPKPLTPRPPQPPDKPPQPPDKPPQPPTLPDLPILEPDRIQPLPLTNKEARESVNINADARSIFLTGGLTGAAMKTGIHYADVYTGAIDPLQRNGLAAYWRDNFSPSQALVPGRKALLKEAEELLPKLRTDANAALHTFERHMRYRGQLSDQLLAQIPKDPLPDIEKAWFNARVDMVRNDKLFNATNFAANAGTEAEVKLRQKLFTHAEASQMAQQADDFWKANSGSKLADAALAEGEAVKGRLSHMLNQAERGSITTGKEALFKGVASGLLIAGGTVVADGLLDKALGNSPDLSNKAHWGLHGIGMPLLLLSKASTPTKIVGSLAMVGLSHLMDKKLGPPTGAFSAFARPSLAEVGLATAGALAPVQDMRLKAGLAVGGWLAGKTWNYVDAKYELTGRTEPNLRAAALAAVDYDLKSPTSDRFNFAVAEMAKFSNKNEAASAVSISDFSQSQRSLNSVDKGRANAALMLGYGKSMLERGARTDRDKWDKQGERIGAGLNYDFGAQASSYLRAADGNLASAIKIAKESKGAKLTGAVVDDAYISQLEALRQGSKAELEAVYASKHDIPALFKELKEKVKSDEQDMKNFGESLAQYFDTLSDSDPRYKAKLARDLAILHVSFGDLAPNPGKHSEHYRNAKRYFEQSFKLDPNASDLPAIRQLLSSSR